MGDALSTSALSRQLHGQVVMGCIAQHGPVSRAEVARLTGLSKQTVSDLVGTLEESGWLREVGSVQGKLGRSAATYERNPGFGYLAVADIGGTQMKLGIADMSGRLLEQTRRPLNADGTQVLETLVRGVWALFETCGIEHGKLLQVVVGVPGVVDPKSRAIHHCPNLPGLPPEFELVLRQELRTPVLIDNEVNLATIGEFWQGGGRGHESFIFVALGTGIGMGVVLDGKLWRGARGAAGEIGYMPLSPGADVLTRQARTHGALETRVSGPTLLRLYQLFGGTATDSLPDMFERAAAGDVTALKAIDVVAQDCACAIGATAAVIDPELCLLGGSIGGQGLLIERVRHWLALCTDDPIPIQAGALGKQAGLLGAVAVAMEEVHGRHFMPQMPNKGMQSAETHIDAMSTKGNTARNVLDRSPRRGVGDFGVKKAI